MSGTHVAAMALGAMGTNVAAASTIEARKRIG
jgi:hypothetical protein